MWWRYDKHHGPLEPNGEAPANPIIVGQVEVSGRGDWIVYADSATNELWGHPANTPRPS